MEATSLFRDCLRNSYQRTQHHVQVKIRTNVKSKAGYLSRDTRAPVFPFQLWPQTKIPRTHKLLKIIGAEIMTPGSVDVTTKTRMHHATVAPNETHRPRSHAMQVGPSHVCGNNRTDDDDYRRTIYSMSSMSRCRAITCFLYSS